MLPHTRSVPLDGLKYPIFNGNQQTWTDTLDVWQFACESNSAVNSSDDTTS